MQEYIADVLYCLLSTPEKRRRRDSRRQGQVQGQDEQGLLTSVSLSLSLFLSFLLPSPLPVSITTPTRGPRSSRGEGEGISSLVLSNIDRGAAHKRQGAHQSIVSGHSLLHFIDVTM